MDVAIIKTKEEYVCFSLFPVGVIGWGKSLKEAITSLNENVYDYSNWLSKPLPKEPEGKAREEYQGEIFDTSFKSDDKKLLKKYAEIALQTAFSFKCLLEEVTLVDTEKQILENFYNLLQIDEGIIGFATQVSQGESLPKMRWFIFNAYKTAKTLYTSLKGRGVNVFNSFSFDV